MYNPIPLIKTVLIPKLKKSPFNVSAFLLLLYSFYYYILKDSEMSNVGKVISLSICAICIFVLFKISRFFTSIVMGFYEEKFYYDIKPSDMINFLSSGKFNPFISCKILKRPKRQILLPKGKSKLCERNYCHFGPFVDMSDDLNTISAKGFERNLHMYLIRDLNYMHKRKLLRLHSWSINAIAFWGNKKVDKDYKSVDKGFLMFPRVQFKYLNIRYKYLLFGLHKIIKAFPFWNKKDEINKKLNNIFKIPFPYLKYWRVPVEVKVKNSENNDNYIVGNFYTGKIKNEKKLVFPEGSEYPICS